jgi:Uma2 family endonuclease
MRTAVVSSEAPPDLDQRIVLRDVTWEQYEALLALFGDDPPGIRMAYLEGALEIMSPSRKHETIKKMVARLIELYALERGISLTGLGSTTPPLTRTFGVTAPHEVIRAIEGRY